MCVVYGGVVWGTAAVRGRKGSWIGKREAGLRCSHNRDLGELCGGIRSWSGPLGLSNQGKETRLLYFLLTRHWMQAASGRDQHFRGFLYGCRSVVSDSLWPFGQQSARLICPWNSPGKNIGVGCHFPLQGIFPTQGSNPGLSHCRQTLYHLSHLGSALIEGSSWRGFSVRVSANTLTAGRIYISALKRDLCGASSYPLQKIPLLQIRKTEAPYVARK